ncbi:MAG: TetR/AcrR family transcriptional regulator [Butyrivibrio sp.]|nr:TetR/AcrR family transcriptional regulator [Butyrivibrio sp.]
MNDRFFDLKKEKQDRMINAALQVFGRYGYQHASTDEIVKTAGISKGLLFHYFESKLGLYAYLYDYTTRFVALELTQSVEEDENRFFELYRQMLQAKAAALSQYPYIYLFLKRADEESDLRAVSEISERREKYRRILEALRDRADITVLGPGTDYKKLWDLMDFAVDGVLERHMKGENFRSDLFYEEAIEYISIIRGFSGIENVTV